MSTASTFRPVRPVEGRRAWRACTSMLASISLLLSGCKTMPIADSGSAVQDYGTGCAVGAVGGALLATLIDKASGKKLTPDQVRKSATKGAVAGCAIGLAATAIGKVMNKNQQAKHEAEMQKEAQRRALQQQQYAATTQSIQALPSATPAQRKTRDAELEKARIAFQASLNQPTTVDLGEGGTSSIQVVPSAPVTSTTATAPTNQTASPAGCTDFSIFTKTAAGQARQYETWCPNSAGQMVRTEVRPAPAA